MAKRPPVRLNASELEQVKTLRASGLTYHAISKQIGRDPKTVKKACLEPQAVEQIQAIKADLADFFYNLAKRMITSVTDEDIKKISAYQRTLSAAVSVDKMRLLRNQSTANVGLHAIVEKLERERRASLARERQQEAAQQEEE